jgi:hypothetical protein
MVDYNALMDTQKAARQSDALVETMSPEQWAERSAAYLDREQREQALRTQIATEPTAQDRANMAEAQTLQLQNLLEQQRQVMYESNKQKSFRAWERFDQDGDFRHINTMIADLNKSGSKIYANVARVDPITAMDIPELEKLGVDVNFATGQIIGDPVLGRTFVKVTQIDGTVSYRNMDVIKGLSGYNDYASAKELARQEEALIREQLMALGYKGDQLSLDAYRRAKAEMPPNRSLQDQEFQDAITKHYDELKKLERYRAPYSGSRGGFGTGEERYAIRYVEEVLGLQPGDPGYDEAVLQAQDDYSDDRRRPALMRKLENVDTVEDELLETGFLDMDISRMSETERAQFERKIRRIEQAGGAELTIGQKKELSQIRQLASLGELSSDLTDDQVGIIDRMLRTVKKYVSDDPADIDKESAYLAFRNVLIRAFAGSQQSAHENTRFIEAAGSLKQQRGPVLAQLRTQMEAVKDAYESIVELNNPFVIKWRTGQTAEKLYDAIEALDDRIKMIEAVESGTPQPVATISQPSTDVLTPEIEASIKADLDAMEAGQSIDEN